MKEPLLAVGDKIRVHGFVMLQWIDPGDYRVVNIGNHYGSPTVTVVRKRGSVRRTHYLGGVEAWMRPGNQTNDLNWIEKL
jgi:hypothetical protein